jgi:hypothetical protein
VLPRSVSPVDDQGLERSLPRSGLGEIRARRRFLVIRSTQAAPGASSLTASIWTRSSIAAASGW